MDSDLPKISIAETLAARIAKLDAAQLPEAVRRKCEQGGGQRKRAADRNSGHGLPL